MTKIEWAQNADGTPGRTWNPLVGCSKTSPGCDNCYAMGDSPHRFPKVYDREGVVVLRGSAKREGLTFVPRDPAGKSLGKGAQWTGEVRLLPWALDVPLRRKKPTTFFVNSLGDTFHASIVDSEKGRRFIAAMVGVMAACPQHVFQVLTKRPHKAREWFEWFEEDGIPDIRAQSNADAALGRTRTLPSAKTWPLPNVWIGVSVEDQARADERIPELLQVPAALRFLSCEPLLGPVDLSRWLAPIDVCGSCGTERDGIGEDSCDACGADDCMITAWGNEQLEGIRSGERYADGGPTRDQDGPQPRWIIAGGESGPKARPCEVEWIRSIVEQCQAAQIPAFVKQLGSRPEFEPEDCEVCDGEGVGWQHLAEHGKGCDEDFRTVFEDAVVRCLTCEATLTPCSGCADYSLGRARPPLLKSAKGGDPAEWDEDIRVREMPKVTS